MSRQKDKPYPGKVCGHLLPLCLPGSAILGATAGTIFPLSPYGRHHLGRCFRHFGSLFVLGELLRFSNSASRDYLLVIIFLPAAVLLVK